MVPHVTDVDAISYTRQIGLNVENASPPTNAYIGRDDRMQVFSASSAPGAFFTVFARVLLPNGTIVPNQWQISPLNGRNGQSFYIDITEGFLLSLTVSSPNAPGPGITYVRVSLIRGTVVLNALSQTLVAGYVTGFSSLCWPWSPITPSTSGRGNIRSITGTTPSPGQNISETVPLNALWRLMTFRFILRDGTGVGPRHVILQITDGTNILVTIDAPASGDIDASGAFTYMYADNLVGVTPTPTQASMNIPRELILRPAWNISTNVQGLVAADQLQTVQYLVEEWIIG